MKNIWMNESEAKQHKADIDYTNKCLELIRSVGGIERMQMIIRWWNASNVQRNTKIRKMK